MVWTDNNIVFPNHPTTFKIVGDQGAPSGGQQEYQRNLESERRANQLSRGDQLQQPQAYWLPTEVIGSRLELSGLDDIAVIHHHINRLRTSTFQGIYHNQNFH